jgi:poly(3-hydroxybutyrate) depolymerase
VALHGDEGRDLGGAAATSMVIDSWRVAADAAGFIVLAPACPTDIGCDGAWSDWLATEGYRPSNASLAWLDAQVDAIEARYDVDLSGEYLAGYSGGAYWLGYYAQARASRFAGVAFVAGGMPAYTAFNACPSCKIPGYFLGGDGDPRTAGQMSDTASAFQACGEEIHLELVPGSHEEAIASLTTKNEAGAILTWFAARPRACP